MEVLPLKNYVRSAEEHQHHLEQYPEDCSYCHIPDEVLKTNTRESVSKGKTKMRGLGTIINALAIVMGGVLGILFKRFLKSAIRIQSSKPRAFPWCFWERQERSPRY
ncbi:MAG: hypothetical protein ACLU9R_00195 [Faecalibacterium sp.]